MASIAAEYIRRLVCGLPVGRRGRRPILLLRAYFDDSGNDPKSPVFVLAGYLASSEQWQRFSDEWQSALDLSEPSPLPKLRMDDAMCLRKKKSPFYGWTEYQRDERLKKFVSPINRHVEHGFCFIVPLHAWKETYKSDAWPKTFDRPYRLLFFDAIAAVTKTVRQMGLGDTIDIVFDSQDNIKESDFMDAYEIFERLCPENLKGICLGFPQFQRDDEILPLQACDMLAWHFRQEYERQFEGEHNKKYPSNTFLANLFRPNHDVFVLWDHVRFRKAIEFIVSRKNSPFGTTLATEASASFVQFWTALFGRRQPLRLVEPEKLKA